MTLESSLADAQSRLTEWAKTTRANCARAGLDGERTVAVIGATLVERLARLAVGTDSDKFFVRKLRTMISHERKSRASRKAS